MAKITPVRPRYNRKCDPVFYVDQGRMYARSRAETIHNPKTPAQQANRSKLTVASQFMAQMQPMTSRGFQARVTNHPGRASRRVGAHHEAIGRLMHGAMKREGGKWKIDYQRVMLSEGNSLAARPMEVKRQGRGLTISFPKGLPQGAKSIRLAVHSPQAQATQHLTLQRPKRGESLQISLPKWAKTGALHAYYTVDVRGESRWASYYTFVPKGRSNGGSGSGRGMATSRKAPAHGLGNGLTGRVNTNSKARSMGTKGAEGGESGGGGGGGGGRIP